MGDIFKTFGDGWMKIGNSVAKELGNIGTEYGENFTKNADKISGGIDKGGLVGGLVEACDVFSPGTIITDALDAFDVIPEDPALREGISAGINIGAGFIIGGAVTAATGGAAAPFVLAGLALGAKDIGDMMAVQGTPMAPAHATPTPKEELKAKAKDAALAESAAKREAYGAARADAIGLAKDKAIARRDGYAAGYNNGYQDGVRAGYDSGYEDALKKLGKDKTDKVESEIDKILSNPNLTFEDMIFALLRAVIKQGQGDVKDLAADLKNGRDEDGVMKKEYGDLITKKTAEIAAEKDPARKGDLQNELQNLREERAEKLNARTESRSEVAEDLKNLMSKLSEMQQALSNILNTQHEAAMSAIRNIK